MFYASIPTINKLTFIEQSHFKKEFKQLLSYRDALINTADFSTTLANVLNLPDDTRDLSTAIPTSFSTPHIVPTLKPSRLSHIIQSETTTVSSSAYSAFQQPITEKLVEESNDQMNPNEPNVTLSSTATNFNVSQPSTMTTICETSISLINTSTISSVMQTNVSDINTITTQSIKTPLTSTIHTHGKSDEDIQDINNSEMNAQQQAIEQISILSPQDTFLDAFAAMSFGENFKTCVESNYNDNFENSISRLKDSRDKKYEFPKIKQQSHQWDPNKTSNNLPKWPKTYPSTMTNIADGNAQNVRDYHPCNDSLSTRNLNVGNCMKDYHPCDNNNRHVSFNNNNNDQDPFPPPNNNSNSNVNINDLTELITRMMSQPRTNSYMPKLNDWYPKFTGSDDCSLIDVLVQWEKMAENCGMSHNVLLSQIQMLLRSEALRWHNAIGVDIRDWESYKAAIINRFQAKEKIVSLFMSNVNEQKHLEKFNTYYARLRMLIKQSGKEITEKQLVTRLLTGLRDTRCRDVVRNFSSSAQIIDWEKIIKNINEIEVEYDLIARSKCNVQLSSEKTKLLPLKWNMKSDIKNLQIKNAEKFVKNSPYFQKEVDLTSDKKENNNINSNYKNFTPNKTPFKPKYNFNKNKSNNKNDLSMIESIDYVEPSPEVIHEIETNQLMLMNLFEENDWNEETVEEFMSMQTCSNCDETGHILENCGKLRDENQFRQQCTSCHTPGITTSTCDSCTKN